MWQLYAVSSLKASLSYWSPDSQSLTLPLLVHGHGQSLAVCWISEHSAEWSDSEKWEKRKWSTQEPLSQAMVWEPLEVGGVSEKLFDKWKSRRRRSATGWGAAMPPCGTELTRKNGQKQEGLRIFFWLGEERENLEHKEQKYKQNWSVSCIIPPIRHDVQTTCLTVRAAHDTDTKGLNRAFSSSPVI